MLTTGNKSEMSVGYATLYGDMAGGLAVLKDVPKQLVYELVRHRNARAGSELVPASVIERAPSAELRADQLDEDSLPPYELLDRVLEGYVERDLSREQLVAEGLPGDVVDEVIVLVDRAEYKRRQAPPGIRITSRRSAATGGCRSRTVSIGVERAGADGSAGRTAIVIRTRAQRRPSSSRQLAVPDPGRAPSMAGRRLGVDVAGGDRADEGRLVRLAHRDHAVVAAPLRRWRASRATRRARRRPRRGRCRAAGGRRR